MSKEYYNTRQLADELGVSLNYVNSAIREGRLAGYRVSAAKKGQWRVKLEDAAKFIEAYRAVKGGKKKTAPNPTAEPKPTVKAAKAAIVAKRTGGVIDSIIDSVLKSFAEHADKLRGELL